MPDEKVVIVHTFEQVAAALEAAAELQKPVTLQSAPDAVFYAGSLYLLHMFEQGRKLYPWVASRFVLDCGDAGAEAVDAMRIGHQYVRSNAPDEVRRQLADIAAELKIEMLGEEYEGLDLLEAENAKEACMQFLAVANANG